MKLGFETQFQDSLFMGACLYVCHWTKNRFKVKKDNTEQLPWNRFLPKDISGKYILKTGAWSAFGVAWVHHPSPHQQQSKKQNKIKLQAVTKFGNPVNLVILV